MADDKGASVYPVASWTGFYLGVNAGYTWSQNNTVSSVGSLLTRNPLLDPAAVAPVVGGVTTGIPVGKTSGFIGGGQVGYNYQVNEFVVGIEADIQGLSSRSASGTTANSIPIPGFVAAANTTLTATNRVDWLGTVRGQLGYTITPALLVYGTGGLAYGEVQSNSSISQQLTGPSATNINAPYGSFASISQTRTGWAAGGGAAWMITDNWTAKLEYLHYDLGSVTYSGAMTNVVVPPGGGVPLGTPVCTISATSSTSFRGDIVRLGLSYKFGYTAAPAVYK
jgi:outer membrane immunogenic protein